VENAYLKLDVNSKIKSVMTQHLLEAMGNRMSNYEHFFREE
jgi:hypothetical protein